MRCCLFALFSILISASAHAEEAAHPGVLLGTSDIDISGHSAYGPIAWCGELLFMRTESGPALIDPETRAIVSRAVPEAVQREPFDAGLFECTQANGKLILWFDDGDDSIIWQTVDGVDSGTVRGFFRVPFYGTPFFDVTDRTVAGVPPERGELVADHLPPGMKLISVSSSRLEPPLTPDFVDGFALLRDDLIEIDTHREVPVGANGIISYSRSGLAAVYEIDPDRTPPANLHSVIIQDIMHHGGEELEFPDLIVGADNLVHFDFESKSVRKDCKLIGLTWGTPEVVCTRLPADFQTPAERIFQKLNEWPLMSPSGRWVAWTKQIPIESDDDIGTVNIYLARTADVLNP